ncbi:MAG: hypothetical protein KBF97_03200 [Bacteroidetes bacterium]|nr:hypothetical protein [Bacteroidota bacterium]
MTHYSEHILELFARGSADVSQQHDEIAQHCAECNSCRELVQEMQAFYASADGSPKLLESAGQENNALVMEPQIRRRPIQHVYISRSVPARVFRFIRRSPVSSTFFGAVAVLFGYLSFSSVLHSPKGSPAYHQYDIQNNSVMIFDKYDNMLWERKIGVEVKSIGEFERNIFSNKVMEFDFNGDDVNEVVILPPLINEESLRERGKIFDAKGEMIGVLSIPFRKINYGNKSYDAEFHPSVMKVNRYKNSFVVSYMNGRSPTIITRYGNDGSLLGTYWHYGHMNSIVYFDVNHDGADELVLSGINDTEDETNRSFAVTIILDPEKIVGNSEASATRGFGLPASDAELRYIRYPNPEIILHLAVNLTAKTSSYQGEKDLRVLTDARFDQSLIALEYFYDSTMLVKDVKFDATTLIYHSTLFKQGKLTQPVTEAYSRMLVKSVLYWDGNKWQNSLPNIERQPPPL